MAGKIVRSPYSFFIKQGDSYISGNVLSKGLLLVNNAVKEIIDFFHIPKSIDDIHSVYDIEKAVYEKTIDLLLSNNLIAKEEQETDVLYPMADVCDHERKDFMHLKIFISPGKIKRCSDYLNEKGFDECKTNIDEGSILQGVQKLIDMNDNKKYCLLEFSGYDSANAWKKVHNILIKINKFKIVPFIYYLNIFDYNFLTNEICEQLSSLNTVIHFYIKDPGKFLNDTIFHELSRKLKKVKLSFELNNSNHLSYYDNDFYRCVGNLGVRDVIINPTFPFIKSENREKIIIALNNFYEKFTLRKIKVQGWWIRYIRMLTDKKLDFCPGGVWVINQEGIPVMEENFECSCSSAFKDEKIIQFLLAAVKTFYPILKANDLGVNLSGCFALIKGKNL